MLAVYSGEVRGEVGTITIESIFYIRLHTVYFKLSVYVHIISTNMIPIHNI